MDSPTPEDAPPPAAPPSANEVFNKYYLELLKTLKKACKNRKHSGGSAEVLRMIKLHYQSFDKLSDEHKTAFVAAMSPFFEQYNTDDAALVPVTKANDGPDDPYADAEFFTGIKFRLVKKFVPAYVLVQFLAVFGVILNDKEVEKALEIMKDYHTVLDRINEVEDEIVKKYLGRVAAKQGPALGAIEETSLGRLAKEIVGEIDVGEISSNLASGGDIFSAFANNEGLGKLVATVGSKIQAKLTSGELNQESLLKDAISLAAKLPGMMGGAGGGMPAGFPDMSNLGAMFSQLQGMGLGGGGAGGGNPLAGLAGLMAGMGAGAPPPTSGRERGRSHRTRKSKPSE